ETITKLGRMLNQRPVGLGLAALAAPRLAVTASFHKLEPLLKPLKDLKKTVFSSTVSQNRTLVSVVNLRV
ncbi:UNVERIFIED_CONTAM: hypothetical protein HDU68_004970, partial [Siphonaria sp. JEL0065]